MIYQLSGHPLTQSSQHVKLTITTPLGSAELVVFVPRGGTFIPGSSYVVAWLLWSTHPGFFTEYSAGKERS